MVGCITRMLIVSYCIFFAQVCPRLGPHRSIQHVGHNRAPIQHYTKTVSIHRRTQHDVIIRFINVKKGKTKCSRANYMLFLSSFPCGKRPPTLFFFSLFFCASILNGSKRCCSAVLLNLLADGIVAVCSYITTTYI